MLIGPFFFYTTVNGENYLQMLKSKCYPEAERNRKISRYYYQQDWALPHRTNDVKESIRRRFDDRIIGLGLESEDGSEIAWPPYSPDLNPCDFFLWGHMKDYVFKKETKTLNDLKKSILKKELVSAELWKQL